MTLPNLHSSSAEMHKHVVPSVVEFCPSGSTLPGILKNVNMDSVRSLHVQRELRIEMLLLHVERSRSRWLEQQMGQKHWRVCMSHLAWKHLLIAREELEEGLRETGNM